MKYLASALATLCLLVATQVLAVTATFTLPSAATTSAGIYDSNGVLIRSLWSNVYYDAGSYTANWNGIDDSGALRPNGAYELRVLSNNVEYTWEGVVGNTSDSFQGDTLHHGYDGILGIAINGTTLYGATGYNEPWVSGFKSTTTNPQSRTKNLLGINTSIFHVVTDGTNVYWSARDPHSADNSFVLVTKVSDDTEQILSASQDITPAWGNGTPYKSPINYVLGTDSLITGLAVQKTHPYLFVSRRALNRLDVLNKSTGALVNTFTLALPGALTVDADDNLWIASNTTQVTKYSVAVVSGTLTLTSLGGITLGKPLALAVSPDGAQIAIADGGTQQVQRYRTDTFAPLGTLGLAGGYLTNGPAVTDTKFFFRDTFGKNGEWAWLAFQPDGTLWVGDIGNNRALRFNSAGTVVARVQYVPGFYGAKVDQNDSTRVFANFLEFSIDYSKTPLAPDNGSWTLVRNWYAAISGTAYEGAFPGGFQGVTTLPAYGRTFATVNRVPINRMEIVELPASGNLRFTGQFTPDNFWKLTSDGSLRWQSPNCPDGGTAEGTQVTWKKQALNHLDASNNPVFDAPVTVATSPVMSARELCVHATKQPYPWEITSTGVLLAFQDDKSPTQDWHLQGFDTATGEWKFRVAPPTNAVYIGPYPSDGYFDVGNFTNYAGGSHHASGRHIFWEYHGENWKGGQTNKWMHLYDDGLVVGQFGVVARNMLLFSTYHPPGYAGMAGNAWSNAVITAADGSRYIYQNDESWHGGLHRWHVTNLESIHEDSIPITLANVFASGLRGTYYNDTSLSNLTPVTTRTDPVVNFDWGGSPPFGTSLTHGDNFSVRWQGFVRPIISENYTFYTSTDDGVRLWVNNVLIIDHWQNQTATEWSGTIPLEANKRYAIKLEYFQHDNTASAQLWWSSPSQTKQIVPSTRLSFVDVSPAISGLNLHEGLPYAAGVSNDLYGWHRSPAQDVTNDPLPGVWQVNTSRYVYRKDLPVDIRAVWSRTGTATLSRDLRPAGASAVSSWTLGGKIAYGTNPNTAESPSGIGQYLEVLDDAGKIIARMYPKWTPSNQVAIYANDTSTSVKTFTQTDFARTIAETPVPFSLKGASSQVKFSFADSGDVTPTTTFFDATSNWQKPTTLRLVFFDGGVHHGTDASLSGVTLVTTP